VFYTVNCTIHILNFEIRGKIREIKHQIKHRKN
jgi:hypothetical protein